MVLKIAQLGQPVLRQKGAAVTPAEISTPAFQKLIDDMIETLQTEGGVGLAAPQVFAAQRLFLADVGERATKGAFSDLDVFINPQFTMLSAEKKANWEGCLSFLELLVLVPRHVAVRVEYLNREGKPSVRELVGFPARVVQHEYDHLDGILTIDRATSSKHIIKASEYDDYLEGQRANK